MSAIVPFVCLYDQIDRALTSLTVSDMKSVEHEDKEFNNDYSVDPLADPRLDRLDLFGLADSQSRDDILNATASFVAQNADSSDLAPADDSSSTETTSVSGSGE